MSRSVFIPIAAASVFFLVGFSAYAEVGLDAAKAILVLDSESASSAGSDRTLLDRFAEAAAAAVSRAFVSRGISVSATAARGNDPQALASAAREAGSRWAIGLRVAIDGRRVLWRMAAYDAADGTLRGADSFVAFAGLTALPMLDSSAEAVAGEWERSKSREPGSLPLPYRLRFRSPDPGASVRFGSESVSERDAGRIGDDGSLFAAYAPFRPDEKVSATVAMDGYWPKSIAFVPREDEKAVRLPALQKRTMSALTVNAGFGRLLGAAVSYRSYFLPDSLYIRVEDAAWAASSFQAGSRPVLHDELRLGFGAYPFPQPDWRFRLSVGAGASLAFTYATGAPVDSVPIGVDLCLEPFWFTLEYHFPRWAIVLENRIPYSVGLDSGYLERGWLRIGEGGPGFLSAGVMFKW